MHAHTLASMIRNSSFEKKEHNDCTVRALAVSLDGDYDKAHAALKARGRRNRCGAYDWQWKPAFEDCGLKLVDVTDEWKPRGRTIRTLQRVLPRGRKFVLQVRSHVAAWNGEAIVDWASGRQHRIKKVYEVVCMDTPKPEPKPEPVAPLQVVPVPRPGRKVNFIDRVHAVVVIMHGHKLPGRVNRKAICQQTGLAHRTVGFALTYLRRANMDLELAKQNWKRDQA